MPEFMVPAETIEGMERAKAFETCHMRLNAATWDEELRINRDYIW